MKYWAVKWGRDDPTIRLAGPCETRRQACVQAFGMTSDDMHVKDLGTRKDKVRQIGWRSKMLNDPAGWTNPDGGPPKFRADAACRKAAAKVLGYEVTGDVVEDCVRIHAKKTTAEIEAWLNAAEHAAAADPADEEKENDRDRLRVALAIRLMTAPKVMAPGR